MVISPGCPLPSIALTEQNPSLKHQSLFHYSIVKLIAGYDVRWLGQADGGYDIQQLG